MQKETIQKFTLDPEWSQFFAYMMSFFDTETDLRMIDTNLDSSVVHAEVIARKAIAEQIARLTHALETYSNVEESKKTTFK